MQVEGPGSLLTPELLDQSGDGPHDLSGAGAHGLTVLGVRAESGQIHEVTDGDTHVLAREGVEGAPVGVQDLVGPPLPHRQNGRPAGHSQPGRPGLGDHRPLEGVTGERALGEDHDGSAVGQDVTGGAESRGRVLSAPLDRDLATGAQDGAEDRYLEQGGLGQGVDGDVGIHQRAHGRERVEVGQVVGHGDEAALTGDVLQAGHLLLGDHLEERDDRPARGEAVERSHGACCRHERTLSALRAERGSRCRIRAPLARPDIADAQPTAPDPVRPDE